MARSYTNANQGGQSVDVQRVHPDNGKIMHQRRKLLRLDIVGIDMFDISESWKTGVELFQRLMLCRR